MPLTIKIPNAATIVLGQPEKPPKEIQKAYEADAKKQLEIMKLARTEKNYPAALDAAVAYLDAKEKSGNPIMDFGGSLDWNFGTMGPIEHTLLKFLGFGESANGYTVLKKWVAYANRIAAKTIDGEITSRAVDAFGSEKYIYLHGTPRENLALRLVFSGEVDKDALFRGVIENLGEVTAHEVALHVVGDMRHSQGIWASDDYNITFESNEMRLIRRGSSLAMFRKLVERYVAKGKPITTEEARAFNDACIREMIGP